MVEIKDLSFSYDGKNDVLNDINLKVKRNERLGVIGPNGAGKTTLFHLICGIVKPAKGTVIINGKTVTGKFNADVGFVFQNPDDQLFNISVYDEIAFGPINMGYSREEVTASVQKAMDLTGTEQHREKAPHHLSGGEKRMVAIASVISMEPEMIIYDEPTSNLDMRARRKVIDFINSTGKTSIIASHDLEFILETCNKLIIVDENRIISHGEPSEIMQNSGLMERHGMEMPHSLLHKMKEHVHGDQ